MPDKTDKTLDSIIGLMVTGVINNYMDRTLTLTLNNDERLIFFDCKLIFDLGITGHKIGEISSDAGLGMALELKKYSIDPNAYQMCSISKDFNDYMNKNEIRIAYDYYEFE